MTSSTPQVHRQPSIRDVSHLWHTPVADVHDIYPSIQNHLQCQSHHLPCPFPMPTSQSPRLIRRRCEQRIIIVVPAHQTKRTTAIVLRWGTVFLSHSHRLTALVPRDHQFDDTCRSRIAIIRCYSLDADLALLLTHTSPQLYYPRRTYSTRPSSMIPISIP